MTCPDCTRLRAEVANLRAEIDHLTLPRTCYCAECVERQVKIDELSRVKEAAEAWLAKILRDKWGAGAKTAVEAIVAGRGPGESK